MNATREASDSTLLFERMQGTVLQISVPFREKFWGGGVGVLLVFLCWLFLTPLQLVPSVFFSVLG